VIPETPHIRRHALVVAYYFPPLGLSGVQRVSKLVKYLPENGWDVTVLTVEPGAYFAFDDELLGDVEGDGVTIVRTKTTDPTMRRDGRSVVPFPDESKRRVFSWLSQLLLIPDNKIGWKKHALKEGRRLLAKHSFDLVYATAPPYTCFLVGEALAREAGLPLVLDYRDDWVSNPRHRYPTLLHKYLTSRKERGALSQAGTVIAINQTISDLIKSRVPHASTVVVPQGYDPEDFTSVSKPEELPDSEEQRKMTFLYTGMFYDAQQPDVFLRAFAAVLNANTDYRGYVSARFVGLFSERALRLVSELGLEPNVEVLGYQNHSSSISELENCDVAWMTIGQQPGAAMISTGKMYEYMGSGKPILALIPEGEARRALEPYNASYICDPSDEKAVSMMIEKLIQDKEKDLLPRGNDSYSARFDRRKLTAAVVGIFNQLIEGE